MNPDETYRNKIGEKVTRTLSEALASGAVTEEQAREIAGYVLDSLDKAENAPQVMDFLTELTHKWPIFDQLLTIELGQANEKKEEEAVKNTEALLKENKIDEALQTAESATAESQKGAPDG